MHNSFNTSEPALRANIQLLKSFISRKAALSYEINQLKIRSNYRQSSDSKDLKDMQNLAKMLGRRLNTIKCNSSFYKNLSVKNINRDTLSELSSKIEEIEPKLDIPRNIFSLNFELESYVENLKEYFDQISDSYQKKSFLFSQNLKKTDSSSDKEEELSNLEHEVKELEELLINYKKGNKKMLILKQNSNIKRMGKFEKVKSFQFLSSSAIQLKSKYLLRDELVENLSKAEKELSFSQEKVSAKENEINEFKLEQEDISKNLKKYENELKELYKKIKKLEERNLALRKEKREILGQFSRNFSKQSSLGMSETLSQSKILSDFQNLKQEKVELFEENKQLRERLSILKSAKIR